MKKYLLYSLLILTHAASAQIIYLDTISFEGGMHGIVIDTQSTNLWQVGSPSKPFFNGAHSLPNAIVTDINAYPTNTKSSFIFYGILDGVNTLSFWNKFDTDSGHAGGFIEDSIRGHSWVNIVSDTVLTKQYGYETYSINFYSSANEISGNIPAFTGTSEWVYSEYHWYLLCVGPRQSFFPDTVWFRFTFLSDSLSATRDGWMIDDIRFQADFCSGYPSVNRLNLSIYPNPAHDEITISSEEELSNGEIKIFNMVGENIFSESMDSRLKTIRNKLQPGMYFIQVRSEEGTLTKKIFIE